MPKAKTGVAAPKMGPGVLSAASKAVPATPGAAPMPVIRPKKSVKPKPASTQKTKAPTPTRGGGGGTLKPSGVTEPGSGTAGQVTNTPLGLI